MHTAVAHCRMHSVASSRETVKSLLSVYRSCGIKTEENATITDDWGMSHKLQSEEQSRRANYSRSEWWV